VEFEQVSVNNLARIEVNFLADGRNVGAALAGSVNLVPLQAFELSHPEYNFTASVLARSNALTLGICRVP